MAEPMLKGRALIVVALLFGFGAGTSVGYYFGTRRVAPTHYVPMAAVTSGMALGSRAKTFVTAFHDETGRWPSSNAEARMPEASQLKDRYVSAVAVGPNGTIVITYTGEPRIEGKTLILAPTVLDNNYGTTWSCTGGTVAREDRPENCR